MSEFDAEVKKAEKELEKSLVPAGDEPFAGNVTEDEFLGDLKMQAQEYGQKIQDAAVKAKDFANEKFSQDYNMVPKNGETVKIGTQTLKWYALDSKSFNFSLHHFSYGTNNALAGIMFWMVTVIDCPQEIKNVRLAAGINSGGAFWLNGKEILTVPGDKDIIM